MSTKCWPAALRSMATVLAGVATTSCALLYDFGGEGGAGATAGNASGDPTAGTTSSSSSSGPWCTNDLCFGEVCDPVTDTCNVRDVDLGLPGQRLHIHAPSRSVIVAAWDHRGAGERAIQFVHVTEATEPLLRTAFSSADGTAGLGFVTHDETSAAFVLGGGGAQLTFFTLQGASVLASYDLFDDFPNVTNAYQMAALQPNGASWISVASTDLILVDPQDPMAPFEPGGVDLGGDGHGLVPIMKDVFAFSSHGEEGRVGVVERKAASWEVVASVDVYHALGIAVDDAEVFYRAQDPMGPSDLVGAFDWSTGVSRIVARSPARSTQMIAVDDTSVYFDAQTEVATDFAIYQCPKEASDRDASGCTVVEGPFTGRATGGMASARLEAGTARERYLVCYTVEDRLRCRVTRAG